MATFFVDPGDITPPTIRVTGELLHHLRTSLRMHLGDTLTLNDGKGGRYEVEIFHISSQAIDSRILSSQTQLLSQTSPIVLGQALLKNDKMDWVIQKATELGVETVIPIQSAHSVIKPNAARFDHQRRRWERIAREAAQQSERWTIPSITNPIDFAEACHQAPSAVIKGLLTERSQEISLATLPLPHDVQQTIILLVGPEGGWAKAEQCWAQELGFLPLTLGPRILRAETAAIVALSVLQSRLDEVRRGRNQ